MVDLGKGLGGVGAVNALWDYIQAKGDLFEYTDVVLLERQMGSRMKMINAFIAGVARSNGIPVKWIHPKSVQRALGLPKGRAKKAATIKYCYALCGKWRPIAGGPRKHTIDAWDAFSLIVYACRE